MISRGEQGLVKVNFHGDELECVRDERGVSVSLRRVCENIGIDYSTQLAKLRGKHWATVGLCPIVADDGKLREVVTISLDSLPMWLATIDAERVADHVRPKIVLYQMQAAKVLRDHFFGDVAKPDTNDLTLSATRSKLTIIDAMAAAVAGVPGMQPDGVAVLKLNAIGATFGVDPEPFRRALPSRPVVRASLNATQVGALIEISAREANRRMLAAGLIRKNEAGDWELTEKGTTLGESFRFARNGHDGFEIRWKPEVADAIVDVAPAVEVLS